MIPLASQEPRPYTRAVSSDEGMNGGTVSMWVEKTIAGRGCSGYTAKTLQRVPSTGNLFRLKTPPQ